MLFNHKKFYINNDNENKTNPINLKKILKQDFIFQNFLAKKRFNYLNKVIEIINLNNKRKEQENYIALHTNYGIFYVINGVNWLQSLTSIYIENEDEDTQNWLLECALERLPVNTFSLEIISLSLHHYLNTNKYTEIYLKNLCNYSIYATKAQWIDFFNQYKFISQNNFKIENIPIKRNIILGRQSLTYKKYKKLILGNIILLNQINFDNQGNSYFNLGSFALHIIWENNNIVFQQWNSKMEDKKNYADEWNLEEYIQEEDNNIEEELIEDEEEAFKSEKEQIHQNIESDEKELPETNQHPFSDVPINLTFSLGQINLTVEEIMQLQPNMILNLYKNLPAQVEIYANGKLIGGGEIVEIDGQIGVQIININN